MGDWFALKGKKRAGASLSGEGVVRRRDGRLAGEQL